MELRMYLIIAFRNLKQGGKRTWLLLIALTTVSGLLIQLLSLSNGVNDSMVKAATTLVAGHVNVGGFYKATPADGFPVVTNVSAIKTIIKEKTPGLDYVIDRHRGWAKAVSETSSLWAGLYGVDVDEEGALIARLQPAIESAYVEGGRAQVVGNAKDLKKAKSVIIFETQAKRLGVQVGDQITLRTETIRGMSNTIDLTVVAVMKDLGMMSNWNMFVSTQTVITLYGLQENSTGALMVYLKDIDEAPHAMTAIKEHLENAGYGTLEHDPRPFFTKIEVIGGQNWTGQKLDLTTWDDEVSFFKWVITAMDSVSVLLIIILSVIIAIGVMNALWIAVRERTNEIGTLRAIGMSRRSVLGLFMIEATLLGFVSGIVGTSGSAAAALLLDAAEIQVPINAVKALLMTETLHFVVEPQQVVGATVGFTVFCCLAALWPAYRASRLPPITAIHQTE